ncbi:LPXTG cell wall anchor domain-containing protein, partial [Enterococcus quebecensis]
METQLNSSMKKRDIIFLPIIVTCVLLGLFGMEYTVYGEEILEEAEVSIPVNGTLSRNKSEEQAVNEPNNEENKSDTVSTVIKDKSIQTLPSTGEKISLLLLIVGLALIFLFLTVKKMLYA